MDRLADGPPMRLLPRLEPETAFFWTSGADGRLRFLRCAACRRFHHPPGPVCPWCLATDVAPEPVSGRGTVHAYTVNHQQWLPGAEPYAIGLVTIDDQPDIRLTTNLVGVEPDGLMVGLPVTVRFEQVDDVWLPVFEPARSPVRPAAVEPGEGAR